MKVILPLKMRRGLKKRGRYYQRPRSLQGGFRKEKAKTGRKLSLEGGNQGFTDANISASIPVCVKQSRVHAK